MRNTLAASGLLLAVTVFGLGCIPYHIQETPRVTGRVLNAVDQTPVGGAKLQYTTFPKESVIASADGTFDFPPIYKWELAFIMPGDPLYRLHLLVEAPGYHLGQLTFGPGSLDQTNQTVFLRPK